jgi:hypothetical protein
MEATPDYQLTENSILRFTTFDGVTQQRTKADVSYIALIYTMPAGDYENTVEGFDIRAKSLFKTLRRDGRDLVPVPGGKIERYDAFDAEKKYVHIMYRLPYMPKPVKAG